MAERYARGLPLRLALASEGNPKINEETWKKAIAAHPEFSPLWEKARGKFLDDSMQKLAEHEDAKFLCWLLERRHPDLFARPAAVAVNVSTVNNVTGVPDDVLEAARRIARAEAKGGGVNRRDAETQRRADG